MATKEEWNKVEQEKNCRHCGHKTICTKYQSLLIVKFEIVNTESELEPTLAKMGKKCKHWDFFLEDRFQ